MPEPQAALFHKFFEKSLKDTLQVANGVPEERRLHQLGDGGATPLWLVGHMANTINAVVLRWILKERGIFDRRTSLLFAPDFAGGSPPSTDPDAYPAWQEVLEKYEAVMTAASTGLEAMRDQEIISPLNENVPEFFRDRFPTVEATLMQMVNHDAYHRGQIAVLAKY